jgi:hypothetical protein
MELIFILVVAFIIGGVAGIAKLFVLPMDTEVEEMIKGIEKK